MIQESTAKKLYEIAEDCGLPETLFAAFGRNIKVRIPFARSACEAGLESIEFSVRSCNALQRSGMTSVGDVIEAIASDKLSAIRNLGAKSYSEIKTRILVYGYEHLTNREKAAFFSQLLEDNMLNTAALNGKEPVFPGEAERG